MKVAFDKSLIGFLEEEAAEYRWLDPVKGPADFIQRTLDQISEGLNKIEGKANWVVIESLTNLGVTTRMLYLTPIEGSWGFNCGEVHVLLPPSPKGRCNVKRREERK